jgi:DNA-binding response OmpR family regulator
MKAFNLLLLLEDDPNDVILTKRLLQRSRLPLEQIQVLASIEEGKEAIQQGKVDVVLLDLNLTDSKGLASLRALREVYHGLLIVLTSLDNEEIGLQAIAEGADDYLVKNRLNEQRIREAINYALIRRSRYETLTRLQDNLAILGQLNQPSEPGRVSKKS